MNIVAALIALAFIIVSFYLVPGLVLIVSRRLWRRASRTLLIGVLLTQLFLLVWLRQHPVITYSEQIPQMLLEEKASWVRETLTGPYAGFYSSLMPLLAYRIHVTILRDDYVAAEVYYLPMGSMTVEWDQAYKYNIIKPLR